MNLKTLIIFLCTSSWLPTFAQQSESNLLYDSTFNWTIEIPYGFFTVTPEEWAVLQNRGQEAFEKTTGGEIVEPATTIFVFKKNQFNYFEANYMMNDPEDGTPEETSHFFGDLLYLTLAEQMPGLPIDTTYSTVEIAGLLFTLFNLNIYFEEQKLNLRMEMYSRVFNDKDFTVNLMYMDEEQGMLMKEAWFASKFE